LLILLSFIFYWLSSAIIIYAIVTFTPPSLFFRHAHAAAILPRHALFAAAMPVAVASCFSFFAAILLFSFSLLIIIIFFQLFFRLRQLYHSRSTPSFAFHFFI